MYKKKIPVKQLKDTPTYVDTIKELGILVGKSGNYLQQQVGTPSFPLKSDKGWEVKAVQEWVKNKPNKRTPPIKDTPSLADKKEQLLAIKIKTAELSYKNEMLEHQTILSKLMPISEVMQTLQEYGIILARNLDSLISEISVLTKDAKLTDSAESIRYKMQNQIAQDLAKLKLTNEKAEKKQKELGKDVLSKIMLDVEQQVQELENLENLEE